jgi:hypothetical protein
MSRKSSAFRLAAVKHLEHPRRGRPSGADRSRSRDLAQAMHFAEMRPMIVTVPMHAPERVLPRFLASVRDAARCGLINLCILVNATESAYSARQLEARAERLGALVDAWNREVGVRAATLLSARFDGKPSMGRVRRVLCDALVEYLARRTSQDPIMVCNDVDQIAASSSYFRAIHRSLTGPSSPCAVAGPVFYGYAGRRSLGLPRGVAVPELYLFNEIQRGLQRCAAAGELGPDSRVWPEGANMAFLASAYCEAGGFDPECPSGEDDQLGLDLHELSIAPAGRTRFHPADFVENAWVATDPRRILHAIGHGRTGMEAWGWQTFGETPGAALDAATLARHCSRTPTLLRARDLEGLDPSVRNATWERVTDRVGWVFFRSVIFDVRTRNFEQLSRVARRVGIRVIGGELDRRRGEFRAEIDWGRSPVLQRLRAFARAG